MQAIYFSLDEKYTLIKIKIIIYVSAYFNSSIVDVQNVSLIPSDNPLVVREGSQKVVQCLVNSDATPAPTITWYLGFTNITIRARINTTSIGITGNRTDNTKTLECRATNNGKPPKTTSTTLNVECKFNGILNE